MNNKKTKDNILHKIMVLIVVFSMAVIDTVPLWANARDVTKEEVPAEGLQEGTKEEELEEEELADEELTEEDLLEEELTEEELVEEELVEEELVEEELEEELTKEDLTKEDLTKEELVGKEVNQINLTRMGDLRANSKTTRTVGLQSLTPNPASDFNYTTFGGRMARITGLKNQGVTDIVFPLLLGGRYNLVTIQQRAFQRSVNINSVAFPINETANEITVEDYAFEDGYIKHVDLGNITNIGDYAFANNNLTEIYIPSSVKRIGTNAFHQYNTNGQDFIVYGLEGTPAQDYAYNHGNTFKSPTSYTLSTSEPTNGNVTITVTNAGNINAIKSIRNDSGINVNGSFMERTVTSNRNYNFYITYRDGSTETISVPVTNIDKVAPTGTISGNPTSWTKDATLTFNATDTGGSKMRRVRRPNGTWVNGSSTTHTVSSNGTYTFRAEDNAGNIKDVSVEVDRIDNEAPTIELSKNGGGYAKSHSSTITIRETLSGLRSAKYIWSTSPTATPSQTMTSNSNLTVTTPVASGTYYLKVQADDYAGNTRTLTSNAFYLDNTAPTVSFGTNGNSTARQSHSTTVSVSDAHSGVSTRQYQWSTSTATPTGTWTNFSNGQTITRSSGTGNIYLHIRATDSAGNVRNSRSNAFNMDNTAPTTPTLTANTTAWTKGNVTVTGTYPSDATVKQYRIGSGSWTNYTAPFAVSSNATIQARAQDSAGNWSTTRSLVISNIDKTLPNGTISANTTAHTSGNVTLTFNATDSGGSGVRRVRISGGTWVNGSTTTQTATSNGTYSFEVEDNAGNTRTVSRTVSNIDKTIPSVSLSKNGGGYAQTHSTVITVTDNLSGVNTIQYRWTTNTTFPTSGLTTVTSGTSVSTPTTEGNHYLHVRATDKVGNVRNFTSNVFRVDRTAPTHVSHTVTGQRYTSGTNYWVRPNDVVTVNFRQRDTLSGNQSGYIRLLGNSQDVRYNHLFAGTATNMSPVNTSFVNTSSIEVQSVNRTEHSTSTGYGTTQWKVKLNTTGHNYELQYYHRDNASNNRGYTTVGRLRVDGTAPTVTLTPNTTGHTNQNVTITATASDVGSGVKRIQKPGGTWVNGSTTTHAVTSNGTYSFVVEDNVGNQRTQTITVSNIDKTLPNGTITGNPTTWVNSNQTLTFRATDTGSGVRRVRVKGGTWVNGATTTQVATQNGTYAFEVEDNAGNTREVSVTVNRIDKTLPNGTITGNPTAWTNSNATLNFTATDTGGSGVSRVRNHSGTWTSGATTSQTVTSNGTYTFRVEDGAGNIRDVSVTVNRIDKTAPTVTFGTNGNSTASNSHSTTVSVSDTDSGVSTRQYQWTTSTATPTSGTWTSFTNGATITRNTGNGNHYLHIRSTDVAGNTRNTRSNAFNLDTTAPTAPTLSASTTGWTNGNVTVTATYPTDATVKQYRIGSGSWLTYTTPIAISSNSTVYARGRDSAGNWSTERSLAISNIDKTLPNGTITGNPTSWTNSNATLTFNATDSGGSGVRRVRIKDGTWVNGSTTTQTATANGTYTFTVEDNAGNTRDVSVTVNRIDKSLPNGTITGNPTSWTSSDATLTFNATDSGGSGVRRVRVKGGTWVNGATTSQVATQNGTYAFEVEDNAGNTREVSVVVNRIDKTLPTVSFGTNGNSTASQSHSTTVNISDSGSGIASSQYQWTSSTATPTSGTWTSLTNGATITRNTGTGNIYLHVRVTDNVGNVRNIRTNAFNMDNTPPTVPTLSASTTGWTNGNVAVTITYPTDATVKQYRIGSGSWQNYSSAVTMSSNGTVQARAQDSAGNWSAVGSINVTNIDKTVPNGSITGNPTSWTNSNATLTFNATDSGGSGVRRVRIKGGTWVNGTTTTQVATQNGSYAFEVEDNAGNTREVSVTVNRIDKTLPNGSITGNPTTWVNSNQTLTFNATDSGGSGVRRVRVKDGTWVNGSTTTLAVSSNGTYVFTVEDNAGNTRDVSIVVDKIDKSLPTGTITGNPTTWVNSNQTLTFTATDAGGSGVRRVRVKDGDWVNGATTTLVVSSNGTYVFTVEDNAGNTRDVSVVVNRIDKTLPNGTITGNPTSWVNSNQTLTFTATDTGGSGVRRVRVKDGAWVNGATTSQVATQNGTYAFEVEDNAGNTREVSVAVNRIDKTLPTVTFGTNGNSTPRKSQSTTVNVTDTGSGVSTRQYQWTTSATFPTSGTWTNFTNGETITRNTGTGNYYLHVRTTDNAGNVRQTTSNVFNVDNTAPIAPTYTPSTTGWTNGNVTVTINYPTDADVKEYRVGSGAWGIYTSTVTITNNSSIFARAFDLAGNESSTSSLNVTNIDKVAPVLNITGNPTDWTEEDEITLAVTTSDSLSGVRNITLPDNRTISTTSTSYKVTDNGDYTFKVTDNAGNVTARTITVDKIMVHYYLYIFDSKGNPVSGAKFELLRDGEVYRTSTSESDGYLDFGKVPPVGKYTLRQIQNSDGIEIKDPVEIDLDVNDPKEIDNPVEYPVGETLEEPVLTSNLNTWTNKDVKVTINYSTDSTIKQYKVNDGEWEEYKTPITLTENSTVYARAYDDVGNWSPETSLEITIIDKAIPTISIEINTEDWVSDKVELTVIAKDDASGVQTTTSTQGLERISQDTIGDTVRSTYLVKDNGSYEFTVRDKAGNTVTDTYTVNNIDKTVPEITVNGNPDDWFRDYELELEVITSDTQSGVKQVTLPDGTVVTGQELDTLTYKVTDNGSYEFIVEDNVGNKTTYTEEVTMLEKEFSVKVTDTGNKPLTGAEFELYRDGELIETVVSDNSGLVAFGTVYTSGDYEIRQTRVPEGYRLNNNIMEVDVADDDINITNYHQSEVLPSTGTKDALILLVMGLASITVITVTNKKRRKLSKEV